LSTNAQMDAMTAEITIPLIREESVMDVMKDLLLTLKAFLALQMFLPDVVMEP